MLKAPEPEPEEQPKENHKALQLQGELYNKVIKFIEIKKSPALRSSYIKLKHAL